MTDSHLLPPDGSGLGGPKGSSRSPEEAQGERGSHPGPLAQGGSWSQTKEAVSMTKERRAWAGACLHLGAGVEAVLQWPPTKVSSNLDRLIGKRGSQRPSLHRANGGR